MPCLPPTFGCCMSTVQEVTWILQMMWSCENSGESCHVIGNNGPKSTLVWNGIKDSDHLRRLWCWITHSCGKQGGRRRVHLLWVEDWGWWQQRAWGLTANSSCLWLHEQPELGNLVCECSADHKNLPVYILHIGCHPLWSRDLGGTCNDRRDVFKLWCVWGESFNHANTIIILHGRCIVWTSLRPPSIYRTGIHWQLMNGTNRCPLAYICTGDQKCLFIDIT